MKKCYSSHRFTVKLLCLKKGYSIIDGNTYNIQFDLGYQIKRFLDTLSIIPYKDGIAANHIELRSSYEIILEPFVILL